MKSWGSWPAASAVAALLVSSIAGAGESVVDESARAIPVAYDVDVLVVGGTTGAVAAAVAAANSGARVFLAAPRPYLGDDMVGTLRLSVDREAQLDCPLARAVFQDAGVARHRQRPAHIPIGTLRPMHVKKVLDNALLDAGVEYLHGCFPTDVLREFRLHRQHPPDGLFRRHAIR